MATSLSINRIDEGVSGLIVSGELDIGTSEQLRVEVDHALKSQSPSLHLDLTGVSFIDSMGIKCLLHAASSGQEQSKPVTFETSMQVQRIVDALGLRDRLPTQSKASRGARG
jgi:anti-anti-sigma factor